MTCYTLNGNRNRNLHNKEYRQMVVEKKRNNCKKHLPYKVGHAKKEKNTSVPSSEIMVLTFYKINSGKSILYQYIYYLKSGSTKKQQSHCRRHNRNM